jgi:hypothetical protein
VNDYIPTDVSSSPLGPGEQQLGIVTDTGITWTRSVVIQSEQAVMLRPARKTLHLYDGWSIWCLATNQVCYYHTVAPGNEVDLDTLTVITS